VCTAAGVMFIREDAWRFAAVLYLVRFFSYKEVN